jgi:hypothetical protein
MFWSQFLNVPPFFDGNNSTYWKVRMRAFLKFFEECIWKSVIRGWTWPTTAIDAWTKDEVTECNWNSEGLMSSSWQELRIIFQCKIAKEAWDIIKVTHEGIKTIKNSKLQMLTSKFEEIMMNDDETFYDFYAKAQWPKKLKFQSWWQNSQCYSFDWSDWAIQIQLLESFDCKVICNSFDRGYVVVENSSSWERGS